MMWKSCVAWVRVAFAGLLLVLFIAGDLFAQTGESPLPPFAAVRQTVETSFAGQRDRRPQDLISRSEVARVLDLIRQLGWEISDSKSIRELTLADDHVLVATFRTPAGTRFMRKIAGRPLIYDRLDRVSAEAGGPQLIKDLVKLPDGERYAKPRSGGGVPDLLDLLPKNASGQTRRIQDYDKPTGRIYTAGDLLQRLEALHRQAVKASSATAASAP